MSVPKLSDKEIVRMDDMQKAGESPKDILFKLQRDRARKGMSGPGHTAVYDFLSGKTHRRDADESRGRPSKVPPRLVDRRSDGRTDGRSGGRTDGSGARVSMHG